MSKPKGEGRPYLARQIVPRFRTVRVARTGNSLGVVLPRALTELLGLARGDELRAYVVGKVLCLQASRWESFTPGVVSVSVTEGPGAGGQELEG